MNEGRLTLELMYTPAPAFYLFFPPQRGEVTSLKPIKEKKQAPARGQKTQRNLVQTRPKPQPAPLRTQKTSRSLPRTTPRPQLLHNGSPQSNTTASPR